MGSGSRKCGVSVSTDQKVYSLHRVVDNGRQLYTNLPPNLAVFAEEQSLAENPPTVTRKIRRKSPLAGRI